MLLPRNRLRMGTDYMLRAGVDQVRGYSKTARLRLSQHWKSACGHFSRDRRHDR
jgi:hypothetical protein